MGGAGAQNADLVALLERRAALAATQVTSLQASAEALHAQSAAAERTHKEQAQALTIKRQRERARLDADRDALARRRRHLRLDEEDGQRTRAAYEERLAAEARPLHERQQALHTQHASVVVSAQFPKCLHRARASLSLCLSVSLCVRMGTAKSRDRS
jgi:hypothetical protein